MQNKVFLIGRLTKDPDLKIVNLQESLTVCRFVIAVNRNFKKEINNHDERKDENVDFIPCVAWNKNAENLYKYVVKGKLVSLEGSLRINKFDDKNKHETRFFTEVVVKRVLFLS